MRGVVIIFLLAVSTICVTTESYANDIFLKCSSLSFGGQVWEGNVSYVKIYPDKNEALFQDTGETTSYWVNHIRSINTDQIWIAECRPTTVPLITLATNASTELLALCLSFRNIMASGMKWHLAVSERMCSKTTS